MILMDERDDIPDEAIEELYKSTNSNGVIIHIGVDMGNGKDYTATTHFDKNGKITEIEHEQTKSSSNN